MDESVYQDRKGSKNKLQCVKEAIIDELRNLRESGKKRVGIVTFGSDVAIIGDGTKAKTKLQCNIYDFEDIVKNSPSHNNMFSKNV